MTRKTAQTFAVRWGQLAGQGSETSSCAVGDTSGGFCLISSATSYSSTDFEFGLEDATEIMLAIWETEQGDILDAKMDLGRSKYIKVVHTLQMTRPAETDIASTFGPGPTYGYHIHSGGYKVKYVPAEAEHELYDRDGTIVCSFVGTALSTAVADAMLACSSSMRNIDTYINTYNRAKAKYGL